MTNRKYRWVILAVSLLLLLAAGLFWRPWRSIPPEAGKKATAAVPLAKAAGKKTGPLRNTTETWAALQRSPHGVWLRNALLDTSRPLDLDIPASLRATNTRSILVQSSHSLDPAFYASLKKAGATFISYIPNNAALVEATAQSQSELAQQYWTAPYQPYYKLSTELLDATLNGQPVSNALRVLTPPGSDTEALSQMSAMGWTVQGRDRTPFGPVFIVQPGGQANALAAAQWPLAQEVELYRPRRTLNDLTRVRLGVSADTVTSNNYLGLTGTNVFVGLNDTGVDASHPDLSNRVYNVTTDLDGHGTHVAATIAGDGTESSSLTNVPPGSVAGASYRGMAPQAQLWAQPIDLVLGPLISDEYLQTNAWANLHALSTLLTNGYVQNNSWGTGDTLYDLEAASYDQAVRDSEPYLPGEQALTYVFAAGNAGGGSGDGLDGIAGTISSPGTAKNVITVGSIDSPRAITNVASLDCLTTNAYFLTPTSDSNLVSYFSSCGPVSPGVEGTYGRFKPDVVAPGVFTISARASGYVDPTNEATAATETFPGLSIPPGSTAQAVFNLPSDTEYAWVVAVPNVLSPSPFPPVQISAVAESGGAPVSGPSPLLIDGSALTSNLWDVTVSAPGAAQPVSFDLTVYVVETNYLCDYFNVLSNLNSTLKPWYRYESGTSMAAAAVSGTLALMQQSLASNGYSPSPALLKALLINGARSLGGQYDFNTQNLAGNEQGWGLVNLPTSLPQGGANSNLVFIDQSPANALSTGQSATYRFDLPADATNSALRITLAWTDPPGNPAAGLALVNNLDLIVTDSTGTNIYVGNDFRSQDVFTEVSHPGALAAADTVNNVENVYLSAANGLVPPYTITVLGTGINVNAVTGQTNNIEQDYALVVSSDDTAPSAALTFGSITPSNNPIALVTVASNGTPLLNQLVGANSPYDYNFASGQTNGTLAQWHFFIWTNDSQMTSTNHQNFTNVAFITFLPPDKSIPRASQEADIDLYVSTDSNLTNLNSTVIANAVAQGTVSRGRGGTEAVVFTNSVQNQVYYVGVKSEDQQAASFGFLGVASLTPFSEMQNGNLVIHGINLPQPIPDGSFDRPGTLMVLGVSENPQAMKIRHVQIANGIVHQNPGDLVGVVTYNQMQVTLNDHDTVSTAYTNLYDDEPEGPGTVPTHGPGSLKEYVGQSVSGAAVWRLDETDNALGQTGSVTLNDITIEPQPPNTGTFAISLAGFGSYYGYVDTPDDATNLSIAVTYLGSSAGGPVSIFATNEVNVSAADSGVTGITPPGGGLNINQSFTPPLSGGVWYYLIQNNSATPITLNVTVQIAESLTPNWVVTYTNNANQTLLNDAHTQSQICLNNPVDGQQVVSLNVGVRLDDPDLDDLVLHLQSPEGASVLLMENRGGPAAGNLGLGGGTNQTIYTYFTEDTNLATAPIKFTPIFASNEVVSTTPDVTTFESPISAFTYHAGSSFGTTGTWTVESNQVGVVNDPATAHTGSNFLALTDGRIARTYSTTPGAAYRLIYYARGPGITDWWPGDGNAKDIIGPNDGVVSNVVFNDGVAGRGFYFDGTANSYVNFGVNPGNFGTNNFTIDYWVLIPKTTLGDQTFIQKRVDCNGYGANPLLSIRTGGVGSQMGPEFYGGGPAAVDFFNTPPIDDGVWHHLAWTRQVNTYHGYLDGTNALSETIGSIGSLVNSSPFYLGGFDICSANDGTAPFIGAADELDLWSRALSPAEDVAIFNAGSAGKSSTNSIFPNMFVMIDGISTNLVITNASSWVAYTNTFVATGAQTTIEFAGNSALSMLLDDITFAPLPATNDNNYFLPEEPLTVFTGQNPVGCWTLDVWDTRADAPVSATLLSWTLDLTFSSTNIHLIVLTNHVPYTDTTPLASGGLTYFAFDVPAGATFATNTLTNSSFPLNLLFNQSALPDDSAPGDFTLIALTNQMGGTNVLDDSISLPPLVPARRYYLAVQNPGGGPAAYTLQIDTDSSATNQLTVLTNGVLVNTNFTLGGVPQYYLFDVPTNAVLASFQVLNATNGPVDLYATYGLPAPGPDNFDYASAIDGSTNQPIIVTANSSFTTNSEPVVLQPGPWYLAAYNPNPAQARSYEIVASYLTDPSALIIVHLTNQMPFTNIAIPGFPTNIYYSFTPPTNANGLQFLLTNSALAGNIDLVIGFNALPTPSASFSGSYNPGSTPERIQVTTNATLPSLSGTWYLAVPNDWTGKIRYIIEASAFTNNAGITNYPAIAQANFVTGQGFTLTWPSQPGQTYEIDISSNLVNWTPATRFTATNTTSSYTDPAAPNLQTQRYYKLSSPSNP